MSHLESAVSFCPVKLHYGSRSWPCDLRPLDKASVFIRGCGEHFLVAEERRTLDISDNTPLHSTRLTITNYVAIYWDRNRFSTLYEFPRTIYLKMTSDLSIYLFIRCRCSSLCCDKVLIKQVRVILWRQRDDEGCVTV